MAAAIYALTHPLAPVAWWALNTPEVTNAVADALGLDGDGPARRLQRTYYYYNDVETVEDNRWLVFVGVAVGILIPIAIWVVVGLVYKAGVTDKRGLLGEVAPSASMNGRDFKYGMCNCCDDCQYLMHGWCFFTIRAADSFTVVGANTFWCVVLAFLACWTFAQIIGFAITYGIQESGVLPDRFRENRGMNFGSLAWFIAEGMLAFWLAGLRRRLRERLGDTNAGQKYMSDCFTYWCCACCNIVQDARQVDEAQGVRVECCCKLVKMMPPADAPVAVGSAVVVGNVVG